MRISLSEHFTYPKLLRFTFPSVIMMIFMSIYCIVDGIFVSNFVGKTPFAAVNLIMPFPIILGTVGYMLGTGGSALVSKTLGEGDGEKANGYFSMIVFAAVISGVTLAAAGEIFLRPVAKLLGADGDMLEYCVRYSRILLAALPAFVLQNVFQSLLIAAEKPNVGLGLTIIAGVTNMALDFLFIAVFKWGVEGAAAATGISQTVGGAVPLVYFLCRNDTPFRIRRTRMEPKPLIKTCTNGSSEMLSNISASLIGMIYNFQLMRITGENGVAAYGVIMYANFIFTGVFFGYALGSAPVISYHFGAENYDELKSLFKKSVVLLCLSSVVLTSLALLFTPPLSKIFVGYDRELFYLTCRGFRWYSLSFPLMGLNVFGSSLFTALNNGAVSAAVSFLRTLAFQVLAVLILPVFFGADGIWTAVIAAEAAALAVTAAFVIKNKNKYHYM